MTLGLFRHDCRHLRGDNADESNSHASEAHQQGLNTNIKGNLKIVWVYIGFKSPY